MAKSLKCGRLMRECHSVIKESFDPYAIEGVINAYLELLKYFSEQVKTREAKVLQELMVFNKHYVATAKNWLPFDFDI